MNWYDHLVLPYVIDFACGLPMVQKQRRQLVPRAQGRVLKIDMGTEGHLPFDDGNCVSRLLGLDLAMQMHQLPQK